METADFFSIFFNHFFFFNRITTTSTMRLAEPIVRGLKVAGPAFFLGMQGSAVKTSWQIVVDKSVGSLSPLPFVSLLTNCVIWSYYGLLKADPTVLVPNGIGILSGLACVVFYHRFAEKKPVELYAGAAAIIAFSTMLAARGNYQLLGSLGCALAVVLTGSPLVTLASVFKTKSTASLPVLVSLSAFLNSASWSLYGLLVAGDPMIYGPNLVGFALASVQMSLYVIFGLPPPKSKLPVKAVF